MFLVKVPDQDPIEGARDVMLRTIEGVRAQPITAAELDRVRAKTIKAIDDSINDPQRLGIALSQSIAEGDWRLFFLRRDRWRTVTPADLDRVATQYFKVGEPHRRRVRPRREARPFAGSPGGRRHGHGQGLQGRSRGCRRRNLRRDARQSRRTRAALALANGMKVALLPKKTRGETVQFALRVHLWRREIDLRPQRRRQPHRRHADARHDPA